ncbi:MAG: RNA-directed DNA polymerase [Thiotrichaceae bacterium]|nr:RNA-directed DNA polymerase [Thiotrichaceae bacterium]
MSDVTLDHFKRAATDIGAHGDNDTLPFDLDNRFVKDKQDELAEMAYEYFCKVDGQNRKVAAKTINALQIFSERLLVPTGSSGFRITTKLHPFWNIYFNGLGVAIAEKHEPHRSDNAHSYRYIEGNDRLFDRSKSWRAYREATLADEMLQKDGAVIVQTDISSFYEHIYHHRLENCIDDLLSDNSTVAVQIDRLLNKFSSGRSFGLPVGGQGSRILAELLMSSVDQMLNDEGVICHRYVDDFTLITESQENAYRALAVLSHALADYGLSLNRSKTTILSAKHYKDYVTTQLGITDDESKALREIDLHFDPYSDSADEDYDELKETVHKLDIQVLLNLELKKAQPDTFLVAQVGRTLKFHHPNVAIQLCATLLHSKNLHAFRASWSTIMRGVAAIRADEKNKDIFDGIDKFLDKIPTDSSHLIQAEANCLHYLKTIRFKRNNKRARFVLETYNTTTSESVKRACIDCWRIWKDRPRFIHLRNQWQKIGAEEQRMVWLAFADLGDEGKHSRTQVQLSLPQAWALGIEQNGKTLFSELYKDWSKDGI